MENGLRFASGQYINLFTVYDYDRFGDSGYDNCGLKRSVDICILIPEGCDELLPEENTLVKTLIENKLYALSLSKCEFTKEIIINVCKDAMLEVDL